MSQESGDRSQESGKTPSLSPTPDPRVPPTPDLRRSRLAVFVAIAGAAGVAVVGFAVWYFAIHEPEPRNDLERFGGEWSVAAGGRESRNAIRVSGDRWEYVGGKAYRITLNEAANPKEIDLDPLDLPKLIGPPPRLHGVYAFDDNKTARVILGPAILPRARSLDDPDAVLVLTKVKLESSPEPRK
jgi:uncharacterized protein (TIGR03067 family)